MTVHDLISASMRKIGALQVGEVPTAQEAEDFLREANRMLDGFNMDSMIVHRIRRDEFDVTAGTGAYEIGTGATWNIPRPTRIESLSYFDNSAGQKSEWNLGPSVTEQEYRDWELREFRSSPWGCWYWEPTYPNGMVRLFPIPSVSSPAVKAVVYSWDKLTRFPDLVTEIALPEGYEDLILYNLAVRIAPDLGVSLAPSVTQLAMEAKARVQRLNHRPFLLKCDPAITGQRGWYDIAAGRVIR